MSITGAHVVFHKLLCASHSNNRAVTVQAVLLCKRTQDAPVHPGYWSFVGGKLDSEEDPEKGLRREIDEEIEIIDTHTSDLSLQFLCDAKIRSGPSWYVIRYFSSQLTEDMDKLRLKRTRDEDKVEGDGLGWFTEDEVHHIRMRPEDRLAANEFFSKIDTEP